jgi:hypothetical protein
MKKIIMMMAIMICFVCVSFGQWNYKNVDNGLDDPYKISYVSGTNKGYLKLQNDGCATKLVLFGSYFCDDYPTVDISFLVNGEYTKLNLTGSKSTDSKAIFINNFFVSDENVNIFKSASSVKIRINESHCESEIYEFTMSGSTAAFNFMRSDCGTATTESIDVSALADISTRKGQPIMATPPTNINNILIDDNGAIWVGDVSGMTTNSAYVIEIFDGGIFKIITDSNIIGYIHKKTIIK